MGNLMSTRVEDKKNKESISDSSEIFDQTAKNELTRIGLSWEKASNGGIKIVFPDNRRFTVDLNGKVL